MLDLDISVRRKRPLRPVLLLIGAMMALLWMTLTLPSLSPRAAADPLATATPTPTVAPDCRLGYTLPGGGNPTYEPTEEVVRALRQGMYYDYAQRVWFPDPTGTYTYGIDVPAINPTREYLGAQHIMLVRVHGRMLTPSGNWLTPSPYYWNAPYALPTPSGTPSWELIHGGVRATAQAQAIATTAHLYNGTLWLIGNEIDLPDRTWPPSMITPTPYATYVPTAENQDGIVPESYAEAYRFLYDSIKAYDPTALVAPGSVVQWTPMREEYYNRILRAYQAMYGTQMPVDYWSVHAYTRNEIAWYPGCGAQCGPYNESIPPGFTAPWITPGPGTPTAMPTTTPAPPYTTFLIDATRFEQQLINLRRWMKANGYQDKPLIVSEFAIPRIPSAIGEQEAETFFFSQVLPWMLSYTDPEIGYPYDGYHLVQRWVVFNQHQGPLATPTGVPGNPTPVYSGFPFWIRNEQGRYVMTDFGSAWIRYVSNPANGYTGMGCAFGSTPQAGGPGAYGYGTWGEDGGAASQASSGGALLNATPTPSTTPTPPDAYPGP